MAEDDSRQEMKSEEIEPESEIHDLERLAAQSRKSLRRIAWFPVCVLLLGGAMLLPIVYRGTMAIDANSAVSSTIESVPFVTERLPAHADAQVKVVALVEGFRRLEADNRAALSAVDSVAIVSKQVASDASAQVKVSALVNDYRRLEADNSAASSAVDSIRSVAERLPMGANAETKVTSLANEYRRLKAQCARGEATPDIPTATRDLGQYRIVADPCEFGLQDDEIAVFFASGSSELTANARAVLRYFADGTRGRAKGVNVDGYADPRPAARGNSVLSAERAGEVANFLAHALPLDRKLISDQGRGDRAPEVERGLQLGFECRRAAVVQVHRR